MKLKDYLIIGAILFVISIFYIWITFFGPKGGGIAKVYQDNQVVIEVDFESKVYKLFPQENHEDYPKLTDPVTGEGGDVAIIILGSYETLEGRSKVYIEIDWDKNSLRIQKDETPKQIGVRRNWYDGTGLPAISLPSKVFIVFETKLDDGLDGAV
ncbi:NusG domain II-containing protein [Acholeplasma granularum]|uniref:NusG domain II-containing protein n=1 Tax=Acholeplasma granularum TaxID=264635 RepID=UPI0004B3734F|nr:NusG domain II-containing protein [Acholeplasma granularum]